MSDPLIYCLNRCKRLSFWLPDRDLPDVETKLSSYDSSSIGTGLLAGIAVPKSSLFVAAWSKALCKERIQSRER